MKNLFSKLVKRKVFGVAAGYLVVAWLVAQVAETLFPIFNAPDWVLKVFITLLALGFPVALVLAWAFDVTPEGEIKREDTATDEPDDPPTDAAPGEGIAVLPFVSMSQDIDDEHMADGIAEEIINALARVPGLKVAARTSAFSFKGQNADLKDVGARLGVAQVLEGSLRRAGDQLRVTAQLISVADGYHLWSERYDRQLLDIFAIQDEIAQAIAAKVCRTDPGGSPVELDDRHFTGNMQAYEEYLKGKWCWARAGEYFQQGIEHLDAARKLDPDFAQAQAWYGIMVAYLSFFGYAKGTDCRADALAAAESALECGEGLPISHVAMGIVHQYLFRDWQATEKHYKLAVELAPGDAVAASWYGVFLHRWPERHVEALELCRRSVSLDPLSADHNAILSWVLWSLGEEQEAYDVIAKVRKLHPRFPFAYANGCGVLTTQGRHEEAVELVYAAPEEILTDPIYLALSTWSLGKAGRTEEAEERILQMERQREEDYFSAGYLSIACLGLDDINRVLDWAETAVDEFDGVITYAVNMPPFVPLQNNYRFERLMEKMNLQMAKTT